jgi:homoserine dehydrogenase
LESIVQRRPASALPGVDARPEPGSATPVILITHETTEAAIRDALVAIATDGQISGQPQMIRIETLKTGME